MVCICPFSPFPTFFGHSSTTCCHTAHASFLLTRSLRRGLSIDKPLSAAGSNTLKLIGIAAQLLISFCLRKHWWLWADGLSRIWECFRGYSLLLSDDGNGTFGVCHCLGLRTVGSWKPTEQATAHGQQTALSECEPTPCRSCKPVKQQEVRITVCSMTYQ